MPTRTSLSVRLSAVRTDTECLSIARCGWQCVPRGWGGSRPIAPTQVPSVQPESRRDRPYLRKLRIADGAIQEYRAAYGRLDRCLDSRRLPERFRPQSQQREPRLRGPDRGGRRGHAGLGRRWTPPTSGSSTSPTPSARCSPGQGHLGAMPATVCDGLWDTPASRHEAACASGSVAALAAMADLRSGAYDSRARRRDRAGEDGAR